MQAGGTTLCSQFKVPALDLLRQAAWKSLKRVAHLLAAHHWASSTTADDWPVSWHSEMGCRGCAAPPRAVTVATAAGIKSLGRAANVGGMSTTGCNVLTDHVARCVCPPHQIPPPKCNRNSSQSQCYVTGNTFLLVYYLVFHL